MINGSPRVSVSVEYLGINFWNDARNSAVLSLIKRQAKVESLENRQIEVNTELSFS